MKVTGIDLSLTSTGLVAVIDGELDHYANPKSKGKRADTLYVRRDRLYAIANEVAEFAKGSTLVVIENPSYGSVGGSAHDRSGLWWLVVNSLRADGIPVATVSPQGRAKYGSGKGNSKKDVVFEFVKHTYGDLIDTPNDDVADAVLLAAMGSRQLGFPVEPFELHESNLAAMEAVLWPIV